MGLDDSAVKRKSKSLSRDKSRLSFTGEEVTAESAFNAGNHHFSRSKCRLGVEAREGTADSAAGTVQNPYFPEAAAESAVGAFS